MPIPVLGAGCSVTGVNLMRTTRLAGTALLLVGAIGVLPQPSCAGHDPRVPKARFATFNASLNRSAEGRLAADLATADSAQARAVAEIIQRTAPDVLLLNEFDYDAEGRAASEFKRNYLAVPQNGRTPIDYPYVFFAPSNTGIPSGFDLNHDGSVGGADDALGFGAFPGQYGMLILSRYPILLNRVRTFQHFLWKDMPDARLPDDPSTRLSGDWYSQAQLAVLPLSSKSHWDVPVAIDGRVVHALASHPTPSVYDGDEDRNGRRNADEIRFWADYINPRASAYIYDDAGESGGLARGEVFVILGDLNADPNDGDSFPGAVGQLLENSRINASFAPESLGGRCDDQTGWDQPGAFGCPVPRHCGFQRASGSTGVGNRIRVFQASAGGATDVSRLASITDASRLATMKKTLLLDLGRLPGVILDNVEGVAFGPRLPDGARSLVLVSDNNFSADGQLTQFLAFKVIE